VRGGENGGFVGQLKGGQVSGKGMPMGQLLLEPREQEVPLKKVKSWFRRWIYDG
jgi:hypothetical protein